MPSCNRRASTVLNQPSGWQNLPRQRGSGRSQLLQFLCLQLLHLTLHGMHFQSNVHTHAHTHLFACSSLFVCLLGSHTCTLVGFKTVPRQLRRRRASPSLGCSTFAVTRLPTALELFGDHIHWGKVLFISFDAACYLTIKCCACLGMRFLHTCPNCWSVRSLLGVQDFVMFECSLLEKVQVPP